MHSHVLKSVSRTVMLAAAAMALPIAMTAQDAAKPAAKPAMSAEDSPSRWDIFAGYSYLAPKGTVEVPQPNGVILPESYKAPNWGVIASGTRYFNNWVGLQLEGASHGTFANTSGNDGFTAVQGGLVFRFPGEEITPFIHALIGANRVGGPQDEPYTWGPTVTGGFGMDYATPFFNHHMAIRLFQADYEYIHDNFGTQPFGGRASINAARLSGGLVFHVGTITPPAQLTVACSANPTSVFPGEPITLTATVGGQDPKLGVVYSWSGDGVSGKDATATVDTANLAPGQHTAKCDAKEGKPGKEGMKPWETAAEGTVTFTVKEFEPPTISCSVNPTTIKPGDTATVTATGMSPQNRPLTYSYSASAGSVNGSGNSATFSSTGAPTGPATITCNVADDKGHNASTTTTVTIEAPPPPPQPHASALCSITFDKDKKRPTRVDNEAKACLDEVALDLQKQSDAKVVVVGEESSAEKAKMEKQEAFAAKHKHSKAKVENFAAQRAVNTKDYLVTEKGIDASRVSVATGTGDSQTVEDYLVPAGANFSADVNGTTPVDESMVKAETRKPLGAKPHHKHKAAAAPAAK